MMEFCKSVLMSSPPTLTELFGQICLRARKAKMVHRNKTLILAIALATSLGQAAIAADNLAKALKYYNQHDFANATKYCQAELQVNPKCASAHYLLGSIGAQLQHNDDAFREFAAAISVDPKGP